MSGTVGNRATGIGYVLPSLGKLAGGIAGFFGDKGKIIGAGLEESTRNIGDTILTDQAYKKEAMRERAEKSRLLHDLSEIIDEKAADGKLDQAGVESIKDSLTEHFVSLFDTVSSTKKPSFPMSVPSTDKKKKKSSDLASEGW